MPRALRPGIAERVDELIRADTKQSDIMRITGVSRDTVRRYSRKLGVGDQRGGKPWEPACYEPDEIAAWKKGELRACTDCTVKWSDEMRVLGRCNGVPAEVLKGAVDDTENADVTPTRRPLLPVIEPPAAATDLAAAVAGMDSAPPPIVDFVHRDLLPCAPCVHREVCSIKPMLEKLDLDVLQRSLGGVSGVHVDVHVECDHFLTPALTRER